MSKPVISIVTTVWNGEAFLAETFDALLVQTCDSFEVCVHNDGSTDGTAEIIERYSKLFSDKNIPFRYSVESVSKGVGYGKNRAVRLSRGRFLCFNDADDISSPNRLALQLAACLNASDPDNCFVGSNFTRSPANSTERFTRWACSLSNDQLYKQIYTSHGSTLIAPTWFLSRILYNKVGGFEEEKSCFPEDLKFFYDALQYRPTFIKVEESLVVYRYHASCATLSVSEQTIWNLRIVQLQKDVLDSLDSFSIWNAGKQGKRFFKSLSAENQKKVIAFCDVDKNKLAHGFCEFFDPSSRRVWARIPLLHHSEVKPPVVVNVKLDLSGGVFEGYLAEKEWTENRDYFLFN